MMPFVQLRIQDSRHHCAGTAMSGGTVQVAVRDYPIRDLRHRIVLEPICEFNAGHIALLAFKITRQGVFKSRGYSVRGRRSGSV